MTHIELHDKNNNTVIFPIDNSVFLELDGNRVECINPAYALIPVETYQYVTDLLEIAKYTIGVSGVEYVDMSTGLPIEQGNPRAIARVKPKAKK